MLQNKTVTKVFSLIASATSLITHRPRHLLLIRTNLVFLVWSVVLAELSKIYHANGILVYPKQTASTAAENKKINE